MATSITGTGITYPDTTTQTTAGTQSLSTSGYQKLPSGMIIQWVVSGSIANGGTTTVTWPISFPTACVFATWGQQSSAHGATTCIVYSWTTTGATMYQGSGSTLNGYAIAIGY
jgi:hypothetical protein